MLPYVLTIFAGAFLLFQVQPLIGKYILPWFGGGPGVWTACLLFFQVLLLGGYAYAHLLTRWFSGRRQVLVHFALLIGALCLLPITPSEYWKPKDGSAPTLHILTLLAAVLGLPYLVLSATGPLLQDWFRRARPGASPYRLYAVSNAGSLLALVSYPLYFESHYSRKVQAVMWSAGFVVYGLGCLACAAAFWKSLRQNPEPQTTAGPHPAEPGASSPTGGMRQKAFWLFLPACASALLLGVTNKLCLDVAAIPFLWVAPLAVYLLSFVICFDSPRWYVRLPYGIALVGALGGLCYALYHGSDWILWKQVAVYCAGLFVCCMVCHGELYKLRPEPARLTTFYLLVSAGGALGGVFVAVVAPYLFDDYYELHWAILACAVLFVAVLVLGRSETAQQAPETDALAGGAGWLARVRALWRRLTGSRYWRPAVAAVCVPGVVVLAVSLWREAHSSRTDAVYRSRNFYGVLTVYEYDKKIPQSHRFVLQHGRITHGMQFADPEQSRWPTTYYAEESGVGMALKEYPPGHRRIGVVGLGTGTLAAWAKPGDYVRIYEINPEVQRLATSRFSYLKSCAAKIDVVLGDARLSLEREAPQQLDILALDAFSSDSIPVHLLTAEAFQLYARHLRTNGTLAVHISNHFLDLAPVVTRLGQHSNYKMASIDYEENPDEWWMYESTWMLLTHNEKASYLWSAAGSVSTNNLKAPLWTDDFASLFQILR